jgi:hypothetical protein
LSLSCSDGSRDPETRFARLEERLAGARSLRLQSTVQSQGLFETSLEGELLIGRDNRARLRFDGRFGPQQTTIGLVSDGRRMKGGTPASPIDLAAPPALNEGLLLGMTRMGILHNLALLASGIAPDGTDGRVRQWVAVANLTHGGSITVDDREADSLTFDIIVGGEPSGQAVLWLDPATELPIRREQVVRFPEGEMRVVETYSLDLEGQLPEESFRVEG